jgi:hypothetical protein
VSGSSSLLHFKSSASWLRHSIDQGRSQGWKEDFDCLHRLSQGPQSRRSLQDPKDARDGPKENFEMGLFC